MSKKRVLIYRVTNSANPVCGFQDCSEYSIKDGFCTSHHPSRKCSEPECGRTKTLFSADGGKCSEHEPAKFYEYETPMFYPSHMRFVYLMYSNRLKALKIGIGQMGRIHQIQQSEFINPQTGLREKSLWYVLKVGGFAALNEPSKESLPRYLAAEKKVLNFWRNDLSLKPALSQETMGLQRGSSEPLGGASETVTLGTVCELRTWNLVETSEGYRGSNYVLFGMNLTPTSKRALRCGQTDCKH